jgi:hypothetical protein
MTSQDISNQMAAAHPLIKVGELCLGFGLMAGVLYHAIDSRLKVGRLEERMELSERDDADINGICDRLLWNLHVARKHLGGKSEALDEYETPHDHSEQDIEDCRTTECTYRKLSQVRNAAHDMADHARSVWHIPTNWTAEQGLDRNEKRLEFILVSLEWARRDILKQLAQLVVIFDEYDNSDSTPPWESWVSPDVSLGAEIDDE